MYTLAIQVLATVCYTTVCSGNRASTAHQYIPFKTGYLHAQLCTIITIINFISYRIISRAENIMLEVPPICLSFMLQKTIMPLSHPIMVGRYTLHYGSYRGAWFRDLTCCRWLGRRAGALSGWIAKRASSCTPRLIKVATQAGVRLAYTTGAYNTRHFVNACHISACTLRHIYAYYAGIMLHSFVFLLCPHYSRQNILRPNHQFTQAAH